MQILFSDFTQSLVDHIKISSTFIDLCKVIRLKNIITVYYFMNNDVEYPSTYVLLLLTNE